MRSIAQCSTLAAVLLLFTSQCQDSPDERVHPVVHFLSPAPGETLSVGIVQLSALATDNVAVKRVSFWRDSTLLGFDEHPSGDTWSVRVDARAGFLGWRRLAANAMDRSDNQSFDTTWAYFVP
jgi:hypothetical protein